MLAARSGTGEGPADGHPDEEPGEERRVLEAEEAAAQPAEAGIGRGDNAGERRAFVDRWPVRGADGVVGQGLGLGNPWHSTVSPMMSASISQVSDANVRTS